MCLGSQATLENIFGFVNNLVRLLEPVFIERYKRLGLMHVRQDHCCNVTQDANKFLFS